MREVKISFQNILAINASAGSGKTYQLTLRYLSLLFLGAHPSKILAVTFTKKAAKEMKERIAQTLMRLSSGEIGDDDALMCAIRQVYDKDIRQKAKSLLALYLSSNNKISTIDSFVHQILRKFCFYASVRHDFGLLSLDESELKARFLELLDEEQKERLADYLYARGEGLEKTLSLFASLYEEESDLRRIKAEFEGYDRAEFFAARAALIAAANRFYAYLCLAKPQKFAPRVFAGVNEFLKTNSFEKLITERENLAAHRDYKALSSPESEEMFASLKAALAGYYEASSRDTIAFLLREFEWYKRAKESLNREKNGLGFDDVAKVVKELLEEGKLDSDFLYFRLDGEIEHILIDEFQDTSILQFRIIRPLLDEILSGIGTGEFKSFFLVGDPKQSIYRFRGAAAGMFENATGYIKSKAEGRYEEAYLDTNYRSDKTPVGLVNDVFALVYGELFKPQKSASTSIGFSEVLSVLPDELLGCVADKVSEYIAMGAKEESITILCYTNDDIEEVCSALEERGIKTQKESSKSLIDDDSVRGVAAFVEYILLRSLGRDARVAKLSFLSLTKAPSAEFERVASRLGADMSPSSVVFEIVDSFGLANPNTVKLMELAMRYGDMYTFFGSGVFQNEKKISIRQPGVTLMSVHKSKGLEFDYCIICDTLKKRDTARGRPILQIHKDFRLKELIVPGKSIGAMLPAVKAAMDAEDEMETRDLLNANYVAMTRAKKGMCIVKKSEGHSKLSALAIPDGVVGEKLFVPQKNDEKQTQNLYKAAKLDKKLGKQEDFAKENIYKPGDYAAIDFGLALHSYFEISGGNSGADETKTYMQNKYGLLLGPALEAAVSLADSFDLSALSIDEEALIYKEISVCTEQKDGARLYRIDFLALSEGKAVLIDFKSSHEAKDVYKKQLQNYSKIVSQILSVKTEAYLALNKGGRLEFFRV
jgi:exodeoxyribonuclease V beta subunit